MTDLWSKVQIWNSENKDLPFKLFLCFLVIISFFICLAILPLVWPFVVGALLAVLIEPLVNLLQRAFKKLSCARQISTAISMIILLFLLTWVIAFFFGRLFSEIKRFSAELPATINWFEIKIRGILSEISLGMDDTVSNEVVSFINHIIKEIGSAGIAFAAQVSKSIASIAVSTATSIPSIILSLLFSIMSIFYLSSDKNKIFLFFNNTLPPKLLKRVHRFKRGVFSALAAQIKSQLTISALLTVLIIIGFTIQNISYPHLFGLLIGFADALPIIGAGLFLIPWSILSFIAGNTSIGIGMAILYVCISVFRQIVEPRIVGKNLGLYPLATMISIYVGYKLTGNFLGIIAGPIMLSLCKVVLTIYDESKNKDNLSKILLK